MLAAEHYAIPVFRNDFHKLHDARSEMFHERGIVF